LRAIPLTALVFLALAAPASARTIAWSGYTWDVRPPGFGLPGPNHWSDSPANVSVDTSGDLVLSGAQGASAELINQAHLGYGTYQWAVDSNLGKLDADEVLGMFTSGGPPPSNNEIDIEPSHWGRLSRPAGTATVWHDAAARLSESRDFAYSSNPPYLNQFTWEPGKITFRVTDGAGATLLDWVVTSGVPTPSTEVPQINYWRFKGRRAAGARSVRIARFTWLPLGTCGTPGAVPLSGLRLRSRRVVKGRSAILTWRAGAAAALRVTVLRGSAKVASFTRRVRVGAGRLRLSSRRLRLGRYRLAISDAPAVPGATTCDRRTLRLRVVRR
jgi:hypothetical protein